MQIRLFIVTLLAVCVLCGCGGPKRPAGMPTLYPCEITITQAGQLLGDADVRLIAEDGFSTWITGGRTDSNGVAKIMTNVKYAGAPAGTFKVLVQKTDLAPSKLPPYPGDDAPFEARAEWTSQMKGEVRPTIQFVKPEYGDVSTTPHSITIVKGKNKATFDAGEPIKEIMK